MSLDDAIRHLGRQLHADVEGTDGHWVLEVTLAERRAGTELRHLRYRIALDEEEGAQVLYFEDTIWERVASPRVDLGGALRGKEEAFVVATSFEPGNVEKQAEVFGRTYETRLDLARLRRLLGDTVKAEGYVLRHLIPLEGGPDDSGPSDGDLPTPP